VDADTHPVWAAVHYVPYWPWLSIEIIKSSFDVARRILAPSMPISPTVMEFEGSQETLIGRVVMANSITLTPGTVTLDLQGNRFRVHALAREAIEALLEGEMDRRVARAESHPLARAISRAGGTPAIESKAAVRPSPGPGGKDSR
jgi:multicomponent Na+:H+ antiporter subunit E